MDKKLIGHQSFTEAVKGFVGKGGRTKEKDKDACRTSKILSSARALAPPLALTLFSALVSCASPALGALPIGPALLCAAPSFVSALSVAAGMLISAPSLGASAVPFIFVTVGVFAFRLSAGALGAAAAKPLGASRDLIAGRSADIPFLGSNLKFIKLNSSFNTSTSLKVFTSLAAALMIGFAAILSSGNVWYDVFGCALGVTLTPLLCYAYSALTDGSAPPALRRAGAGAALFALALSIKGFEIGGMKVTLIVSIIISLISGYTLGIRDGVLISIFAGFALGAEQFAIFPTAALCAGAIGAYSPGIAAVTAASLSSSLALFSEGIGAISRSFPEILLSAALFYPAAKFGIISALKPDTAEARAAPMCRRSTVGDRLMLLSSALDKTSKLFESVSEKLRRPSRRETRAICDLSFSVYCDECSKRSICRERENFGADGVIDSSADKLAEAGRVDISCLPQSMVRGCPDVDAIIARINAEYKRLLLSCIKEDKCASFASSYSDISKLIEECVERAGEDFCRSEEASAALSEKLKEEGITYETVSVYGKRRYEICVRGLHASGLCCGAEDLRRIAEEALGCPVTEPEMSCEYDKLNMFAESRRRYGVHHGEYSKSGSREANGDRICSFSGADDSFYMVICDGMGSGGEASLTAGAAALFLERMLGAGSDVPVALEMLNNFTKERRLECFSTVDLLKVDPYSGEATFYKCGAAPSFVQRDGRLFKIECDASPLGILDRIVAKSASFSLKSGDRVIMMSDGVYPDGDDASFLEFLSDAKRLGNALPEAAKAVAEEAIRHAMRPDDASVGVVRIVNAA
ncbi:MAG: SpoIIE family protein phosphatase [Clostridia bacterium]|nr:SpoIIE family protein phosphatase [Clostridia bacterium]